MASFSSGMAIMKDCIHCGSEFDQTSSRKRKVGGKISECPDCVESIETETATATIGVMSGEGKDRLGAVKIGEHGGNGNHKGKAD